MQVAVTTTSHVQLTFALLLTPLEICTAHGLTETVLLTTFVKLVPVLNLLVARTRPWMQQQYVLQLTLVKFPFVTPLETGAEELVAFFLLTVPHSTLDVKSLFVMEQRDNVPEPTERNVHQLTVLGALGQLGQSVLSLVELEATVELERLTKVPLMAVQIVLSTTVQKHHLVTHSVVLLTVSLALGPIFPNVHLVT
jgi:hypothetical protein